MGSGGQATARPTKSTSPQGIFLYCFLYFCPLEDLDLEEEVEEERR
jgi:hypothetical protein